MSVFDVLNRTARGLHDVSHRRSFDECGTLICQDARRVLAGLGKAADHVPADVGDTVRRCFADGEVWPCSYEQAHRFDEFGGKS